jgi:hypothetical protein
MEADKIPDFLADQRDQAPSEAQALFLNFEDFWERKLWHQLTDALIEFFRLPESAPQRLPIFKSFILSFADRINQLKLVSLGLMASTQCKGMYICPFSRTFLAESDIDVAQTTKNDSPSSQRSRSEPTNPTLRTPTYMPRQMLQV